MAWSPVEPTPEIADQVRALGQVRHLISPNKLHYLFLEAWRIMFPEARM
jgi:hypothetical protein